MVLFAYNGSHFASKARLSLSAARIHQNMAKIGINALKWRYFPHAPCCFRLFWPPAALFLHPEKRPPKVIYAAERQVATAAEF